ncbi:hypothetical protein HK103_005065 [Boothiomyces macroporosus]|uniref:Uncharacterized protein n=1 Tax=Boothiomyces macroporosus TaxID=261099 RepID=A0AAD5Y7R5_9FUNG|nr:hypothetical protein HK103_005065 [Boothiomyces macroporosus]
MFSWDEILALTEENFLQGANTAAYIDGIYHSIVSFNVDNSDEKATMDNILHLFRITQLVLQAKNNLLLEAEGQLNAEKLKAREQEIELKRLRIYGKGDKFTPELIELEKNNETLQRNLEETEETLEQERQANAASQAVAREDKQKLLALQDTNKRLEADLRETKMQLSTQRTKLQSRHTDEDSRKAIIDQKNLELNQFAEEIKLLSTENQQLNTELEAVTSELETAVGEIEQTTNEIESLRVLLAEADDKIDQISDERDALKIKVEDLADQLEMKDKENKKEVRKVQIKMASLQDELTEYSINKQQSESKVKELQDIINKLHENDSLDYVEQLKQEIAAKDETIAKQKKELQEAATDFELLANDWNRVDQILSGMVQKQKIELPSAVKLKEKITILKQQRKDDHDRIDSLIDSISEREKEIVNLKEYVLKFENGEYGLAEAIKETKILKAQIQIMEKEIIGYTAKISDFEAQCSDLIEENYGLRSQLGLGESKLDFTNFKKLKVVELEKTKALVLTLQQEIDKLEEERLQFKSKLRLQAMERGERAVELGLDVSDLIAVEEYAEKLRKGDIRKESLHESRPIIQETKFDKLLTQLENSFIMQTEVREKLEKNQEKMLAMQSECELLESTIMELTKLLTDQHEGLSQPTVEKIDQLNKLLTSKHQTQNVKVNTALKIIDTHANSKTKSLKLELDQKNKEISELNHKFKLMEEIKVSHLLEIEKLHEKLNKMVEINNHLQNEKKVKVPVEELLDKPLGFMDLVEQLIECKQEVGRKGIEVEKSNKEISLLKEKYGPIERKAKEMYNQFIHLKKQYVNEVEACKKQIQSLQVENEELTIKAKNFDDLNISGDTEVQSLSRKAIQAQRKVVVLEVKEKTMTRKVSALSTTNQLLEKEIKQCKADFDEMEAISKQTIVRLSNKQKELQNLVNELQERLSTSVPTVQYNVLEHTMNMYISKAQILTEKQQHIVETGDSQVITNTQYQKLKSDLEIAQLQLLESNIKIAKYENFEKMSLDIGELRKTNANLEAKVQLLEKRITMADDKAERAVHSESKMKGQLAQTDKLYLESKEQQISLEEEKLMLLKQYEGGATKDVYEEKLEIIRSLEKTIQSLNAEVDKSTKQASHLMNQSGSDEKEINLLKAAVKELQMHDDEKLIIGQLHEHILSLQKSEESALNQAKELKTKCIRLENENDVLRIKDKLSSELIDSLKNESNSHKRILAWHEKTVNAQAQLLDVERKLETLKQDSIRKETDAVTQSKRIEELENTILQMNNQHDFQLLEWERQQGEFEKTIGQYEEERDRIYLSTTSEEMKETLPDRSLPIGEQLEASLRLLVERTRQIKVVNTRYSDLEKQYSAAAKTVKTNQNIVDEYLVQIKRLEVERDELRHQNVKLPANVEEVKKNVGDKSRIREANALKFAQETVQSLQKQLAQKGELVEKYRDMLQTIRKECMMKYSVSALEEKNKLIHSLTMKEINRYQNPELIDVKKSEKDSLPEIEMINELQKLVATKDLLIDQLNTKIAEKESNLVTLLDESKKQEQDYISKIKEMEQNIKENKEKVAKLESELQVQVEQNNKPPIQDLSDVVHRLEQENETKQQTINSLSKAIKKLKGQLLNLTKELETKNIVEQHSVGYSEEALHQRTKPLADKITQLETKVKKLLENNEKLKHENQVLQQDIGRVSGELVYKNVEESKLQNQLKACKEKLRQANMLNEEELRNLKAELHRPLSSTPSKPVDNFNTWEIEKVLQKKIDNLRGKLKTKTMELEAALKTVSTLRESHSRVEKDRLRLMSKISKLGQQKEHVELPNLPEKLVETVNTQQPTLLDIGFGTLKPNEVKLLEKKSHSDLILIIGTLTKEIEKLTATKEQATTSHVKYTELVKQFNKLKSETQEMEQLRKELADYKETIKKTEQESVKLRQKLRKEAEKTKAMELKNKQVNISNEELIREIVELRKLVGGIDTAKEPSDDYVAIIKEKEALIQQLMNPDTNEMAQLTSENRNLKRQLEVLNLRVAKLSESKNFNIKDLQIENQQLKSQLEKFKGLNEELEDLRYNYKESLKQVVMYEQQLATK